MDSWAWPDFREQHGRSGASLYLDLFCCNYSCSPIKLQLSGHTGSRLFKNNIIHKDCTTYNAASKPHWFHAYLRITIFINVAQLLRNFPEATYRVAPGSRATPGLVSQARLHPHPRREESGQMPIPSSFVTRRKFFSVLIDLDA